MKSNTRRTGQALVAVALVVLSQYLSPLHSPVVAVPGDPFPADQARVFIAQGAPTQLYVAETDSSGLVNFVAEGPVSELQYNAIGYNPVDGFVYGVATNSSSNFVEDQIIRVGEDGVVTAVDGPGGAPLMAPDPGLSYNVGTFADDGLFYIGSSAQTHLTAMRIDGPLVDRGADHTINFSLNTGPDAVFTSGYFWSVHGTDDTLLRIDPADGSTVSIDLTAASVEWPAEMSGDLGAQFVFGNGNLGLVHNQNEVVGQLQLVNPTSAAPSALFVGRWSGPASSNNDGAATPGPSVDLSVVKTGPTTIDTYGQITYTLVVTNNGPGASSGFIVTDTLPAGMSGLSSPNANCTISATRVRCAGGALDPGEQATITINATPSAASGRCFTNRASVLGNEADPVVGNNASAVETCAIGSIDVTKSANPVSGTRVDTADVVVYTLSFTNSSTVAGEVDEIEHLADVVDDAEITGISTPGAGNPLSAVANSSGSEIAITGDIEAGDTWTVRVEATVKALRTNNNLVNYIVANGEEPPSTCEAPRCTEHPAGGLVVSKTSDPVTGSSVATGDTIKFTLTFDNTLGRAAASIGYIDDATETLDDADLIGEIAVLDDEGNPSTALIVVHPTPKFGIMGDVPAGEVIRVTYSVKVRPAATRGNDHLRNVLFSGTTPPPEVPTDLSCTGVTAPCTHQPIADRSPTTPAGPRNPLARTGVGGVVGLAAIACMMFAAGLGLTRRSRRRIRIS